MNKLILGLTLAALPLFSHQLLSAEVNLTQAFKGDIISKVAQILEDEYVYPERGKVAANELNHRFQTGYFDEITDPQIFAYRITGILDVISDLHLWVNYHADSIPVGYSHLDPGPEQQKEYAALLRRRNFGFERIERLPGNLGYIEFRDFYYEEEASERILANVMEVVEYTDGLIIDLRRNGGGHPEMVSLLLSYLVEGGTLVGTLRYRQDKKIEEYWTREEVAGPHFRGGRPVYVLISRNTFSAAEAFSYALQARGRAILVGERTQGGAHPSDNVRLHEHFMMSVPVAASIDPITQSNWQYVGVRPEHEVPAEEALSVAQKLLLEELIAAGEDSVARREQELVLRRLDNQALP